MAKKTQKLLRQIHYDEAFAAGKETGEKDRAKGKRLADFIYSGVEARAWSHLGDYCLTNDTGHEAEYLFGFEESKDSLYPWEQRPAVSNELKHAWAAGFASAWD